MCSKLGRQLYPFIFQKKKNIHNFNPIHSGGAPWSVRIPMAGIMTIGFDVSKDSQNKNMSFGCLVATMDLKESVDFFATVCFKSERDCSKAIIRENLLVSGCQLLKY